jgi:carboxypeptidase C (cathepsin A)
MSYAVAYLNKPDVKAALHVNDDIRWSECSAAINYNRTDSSQAGTSHLYKKIVDRAPALKVLVYSGDDDSVCGTQGTQRWIFGLGYDLKSEDLWREYIVDGQLAGYRTTWAHTNLAFLTVHGAGHEVPAFKPAVAADLWQRFLSGNWTV